MNHKIQIACVGSPFGADSIAWRISGLLLHDAVFFNRYHEHIEIHRYDRPGLRLLEYINKSNYAIIVDAAIADQNPGTILRFDRIDLCKTNTDCSTHQIGVFHAIALGNVLNLLPEYLTLFAMVVGEKSNWQAKPDCINDMIRMITLEIDKIVSFNDTH